jgi:hypothetical protein
MPASVTAALLTGRRAFSTSVLPLFLFKKGEGASHPHPLHRKEKWRDLRFAGAQTTGSRHRDERSHSDGFLDPVVPWPFDGHGVSPHGLEGCVSLPDGRESRHRQNAGNVLPASLHFCVFPGGWAAFVISWCLGAFVVLGWVGGAVCHPERGPPRAESKDPLTSPETVSGFGGSLDYGVASLRIRSG